MSKKSNPTAIGAFVIGALVLAVAALVFFGSSSLLQEKTQCVMYFDGSIGGLDVGAPVEFRGVKVGTVSSIELVFDNADDAFRIPVIIDLSANSAKDVGGNALADEKDLDFLISKGLRGQLQAQSMVTGKLKIELGFHPDAPANLAEDHTGLPQIPALPTTMEAIRKKLQELPLAEIVQDLHDAISGAANVINSDETREVLANLNGTLKNLQQLTDTLDRKMVPLADSLQATAEAANESLRMAGQALKNIEQTVDADSPLRYQMVKTLEELSAAARSVRILVDGLERDPSSWIRGKSAR
jgi:paraquat-inducible protein B